MDSLLQKIKQKKAELRVVGLGYIGLPLTVHFAAAGFNVVGVDISKPRVQEIEKKGADILQEPGFDTLWEKAANNFTITSEKSALKGGDVFFICVPTPVREGKPDISYVEQAMQDVQAHLKEEQLVVLESTVPPGTSRALWEKHGQANCALVHCPERVMPGKLCHEFVHTNRVIGGDTNAVAAASALYKTVVQASIEPATLEEAELAKLVENAYRNTNIAFANEVAQICDKLGVNSLRVIEMANEHPRVHVHLPGCGVGGNCIPVAPVFLMQNAGLKESTIQTALETNEAMPAYLVQILEQHVPKGKIVVLGYSYKPGLSDVKRTPVKDVVQLLDEHGYETVVIDPYVQRKEVLGMDVLYKEAEGARALILATAHPEFKKLDWKKLKGSMKRAVLIDGRAFYDRSELEQEGFVYDGIGV